MRKFILFLSSLLFFITAYPQVGINTSDPKATLDVAAYTTNSSTAEGIIAPKLTRNQLISKDLIYNSDQKGAIVYVTDLSGILTNKTSQVTNVGYYYFDGSVWQSFGKAINVNNGLTSRGNQLYLGGELTEDTRISSTNNNKLSLDIPTDTKNLTVNGILGVTGNLSSNGETTLTSTVGKSITIDGSIGQGIIIKDGKNNIGGKFLQADADGRATWQSFGAKNATPQVVFSEVNGIYYNPLYLGTVDSKTSITLPSGKWLVQCVFLFIVNSVDPLKTNVDFTTKTVTDNKLYSHWVQIRMSPQSGLGANPVASLVSGNIYKYVKYNIVSGYFIVDNNTSSDVKYSFNLKSSGAYESALWPGTITTVPTTDNQTNSQFVQAFAKNNGENAVVAFQLAD